jgi:hypothetical protein
MKLKVVDKRCNEFHVDVLDESGQPITDEDTGGEVHAYAYEFPVIFRHQGELYQVISPFFGLSNDWCIYKMQQVTQK